MDWQLKFEAEIFFYVLLGRPLWREKAQAGSDLV